MAITMFDVLQKYGVEDKVSNTHTRMALKMTN